MRQRFRSIGLLLALLLASMQARADDVRVKFFREKIEPVLKTECYSCHATIADEVQGGLRLDSRDNVRKGGESGAVIEPGKASTSLLIRALRHQDGLAMPPKKKLSDETIAVFIKWIDDGAFDPRERAALTIDDEINSARGHWAFQPIRSPNVPKIAGNESLHPIDALVLEKLTEQRLARNGRASRREYIRRVTFDLIGLPPTPDEIASFEQDRADGAEERLVDRLLKSPRFGEKWATHWLDVVRFAESEGYEYDRHIPDAWRYRDYVINAFNNDKPFDQFIIEQLAGDELLGGAPVTVLDDAGTQKPELTARQHELYSAAIFHRLGPVRRNAGNPDIALSRNEVLTERTDIIGSAILGMTVGCARCHHHKLEPISQRDYYRLQAFLAGTQEHNLSLASVAEQKVWEADTAKIKAQISDLQAKAKKVTGPEKNKLDAQIEDLVDQLPTPLATIPTIRNDAANRTAIHVLRRGVWEQKAERVGPRPLSVLVSPETEELAVDDTQPRLKLAQWLVSKDNPLTARVIVNRLWQQHFGRGLVKTVNDFGTKGDAPTHPELLDWLAASLRDNGWQLKPLHRAMVLSETYRQASTTGSIQAQQDPENRWLSRFSKRRLSAEELRDAMLSISGRIQHCLGGTSVSVPVDRELVNLLYRPAQWTVTKDPREHDRRSIYLLAKRNLRLPFFENLDAPALLTSCGRREVSTHPPQALELLNGRLSNDLAITFAARLQAEARDDMPQQVRRAFELALGREPSVAEVDRSLAFLREQPMTEFTLALFNLHEFLVVP